MVDQEKDIEVKDHAQISEILTKNAKVRPLGHGLAATIIGIVVLVFGISIYQLDFWETYFYSGTQALPPESCEVAVSYNTPPGKDATFQPVKIPHATNLMPKLLTKSADRYYASYTCHLKPNQESLESQSVPYLHLSWLWGAKSSVRINGTERVVTHTTEKPIIPLRDADLNSEKGITIDILIESPTTSFGIAGLAPTVLATTFDTNSRVVAVEYSLKAIRPLYKFLPLLSLSLILVFAWMIGYSYPIMVATFDYAMINSLHHIVAIIGDRLGIGPLNLGLVALYLQIGTFIPFLHFALHLFGFNLTAKKILILVVGNYLFIAGFILYTLNIPNAGSWYDTIRSFQYSSFIIIATTILILGLLRFRKIGTSTGTEKNYRGIILAFLVLVICLLLFYLVEFALFLSKSNAGVDLTYYSEQAIPFFIGGILVFVMTTMDKVLEQEKSQRIKYEAELTLASSLQNILLPTDLSGKKNGWSFKICSKSYGILGGDWAKVVHGENRSLFLLGDVVGKGASAALTHSGIAAIWESSLDRWLAEDDMTGVQILKQINDTMFRLYDGSMNTTFSMVETVGSTVKLVAGGNIWLHIDQNHKCTPIMPAAKCTLGNAPNLSLEVQEIDCAEGDVLITFTDGVLEGSRALRRFVKELKDPKFDLNFDPIEEALDRIGKKSVLPDDASSLLLKRAEPT